MHDGLHSTRVLQSCSTAVLNYLVRSTSRVGGGPKSDRSSSTALKTLDVEDWAILGLETALAGALSGHPAVG